MTNQKLKRDESYESFIGALKARTVVLFEFLRTSLKFLNETSLLKTVVKDAGHEVLFYPKFHCELNYIEFFLGAVKRYTLVDCTYSFPDLKETLPVALNSVSLQIIRWFANRGKRWMSAYISGLTPAQKEFANCV